MKSLTKDILFLPHKIYAVAYQTDLISGYQMGTVLGSEYFFENLIYIAL